MMIDNSNQSVPTVNKKIWGKDNIQVQEVLSGNVYNGYLAEWEGWELTDDTYDISSNTIYSKVYHYPLDYSVKAKYKWYSQVTVKNFLNGEANGGNVGTVIIRGVEKTLPLASPELALKKDSLNIGVKIK